MKLSVDNGQYSVLQIIVRPMPIRFKLKSLIKKKGYGDWSYRQLAKEIGVGHSALHIMCENITRDGKTYSPSMEVLEKLCRFFGCRPGDLLTFKK